MSRQDMRRETSGIKQKLFELQDYLEVRNQLERVPECKLKDALLEEIEKYLNPSVSPAYKNDLCSSVTRTTSSVEISEPSHIVQEKSWEDDDAGHLKKPNWFLWLVVAFSMLTIGSCAYQGCHYQPS